MEPHVWALLAVQLVRCAAEDFLSCDASSLDACPDGLVCSQQSGKCECPPRGCPAGPHDSDVTSAVPAVLTVVTLTLLLAGAALLSWKYRLLQRLREQLQRRHHVMYEDVMIGQDDPPIDP